jgi:uncharacterized membrane protein
MKAFDGRIFEHPVHMMLIHFPIGLLTLDAASDALVRLGYIGPFDPMLLLLPGVALGWIAAGFGFWDLVRIKSGSKAMAVALTHGSINVTAISGFSWALYLASKELHPELRLWIEIVSGCLILVGNKFGGDLVLKYFVGSRFERPI